MIDDELAAIGGKRAEVRVSRIVDPAVLWLAAATHGATKQTSGGQLLAGAPAMTPSKSAGSLGQDQRLVSAVRDPAEVGKGGLPAVIGAHDGLHGARELMLGASVRPNTAEPSPAFSVTPVRLMYQLRKEAHTGPKWTISASSPLLERLSQVLQKTR